MTSIIEVHPRSKEVHIMPYAPDVFVEGAAGVLFLAGAADSPLYHQHLHVPEDVLPTDVKRRTLANIKMVLGAALNYLSEPGARFELDMIVPSVARKPGAFRRRGVNNFR